MAIVPIWFYRSLTWCARSWNKKFSWCSFLLLMEPKILFWNSKNKPTQQYFFLILIFLLLFKFHSKYKELFNFNILATFIDVKSKKIATELDFIFFLHLNIFSWNDIQIKKLMICVSSCYKQNVKFVFLKFWLISAANVFRSRTQQISKEI